MKSAAEQVRDALAAIERDLASKEAGYLIQAGDDKRAIEALSTRNEELELLHSDPLGQMRACEERMARERVEMEAEMARERVEMKAGMALQLAAWGAKLHQEEVRLTAQFEKRVTAAERARDEALRSELQRLNAQNASLRASEELHLRTIRRQASEVAEANYHLQCRARDDARGQAAADAARAQHAVLARALSESAALHAKAMECEAVSQASAKRVRLAPPTVSDHVPSSVDGGILFNEMAQLPEITDVELELQAAFQNFFASERAQSPLDEFLQKRGMHPLSTYVHVRKFRGRYCAGRLVDTHRLAGVFLQEFICVRPTDIMNGREPAGHLALRMVNRLCEQVDADVLNNGASYWARLDKEHRDATARAAA